MKQKYKFIKSSYNSLKGNPNVEKCFDLCKDMHVLAKLASTIAENYMKMKNHIYMLTKQLSSLSCEYNLPFEALQVGSTSNLSIDSTMVESIKVYNLLVKRTREKPLLIWLVPAVEKAMMKKSQGRKNQPSDINPKEKYLTKKVK